MTGFWRGLLAGQPTPVFEAAISPETSFDLVDVPAEVFGFTSYAAATPIEPRISRREAVQVAAVKRSRDLIAGSLGTLPLVTVKPDLSVDRSSWLTQPERDVPRSVTMTRLVEDLLYESIAWWKITAFDWRGYPAQVVRLDPRSVSIEKDGRVHVTSDGRRGMSEEWPSDSELIRFDSPNDALLSAGARAIRQCLTLDVAAKRYAEGAPPLDYFTPADGIDPGTTEEITGILDAWQSARQKRATAYVPAALTYNNGGFNPEQLELAAQRQHAVLEIARVAGVDAEDLGVSTTSRTYQNSYERRKAFVDFTLGGYRAAIEDRLSMGDVTPHGTVTRFDLDAFLRTDAKTRYEAAKLGIEVGALTREEIREGEGRPAIAGEESSSPAQEEPMPEPTPIAASFDAETMEITAPAGSVFAVDTERRTIRGRAVPYGVQGFKDGKRFQFSKGTIHAREGMVVKLWSLHDKFQAVGVVTEWDDNDDGLDVAFKVARGPEGDRALTMAEDGVWDGLSIGPSDGAKYAPRDGVFHAVDIPIHEISLTPAPVFGGARVQSVAFDTTEENTMPEDTTEVAETVTEATSFDSLVEALTGAITTGFEGLSNPQGREVVTAGHATFEVNEAPQYRFDGTGDGEHEFSVDVIAAAKGDREAAGRVTTFMADELDPVNFAVSSANVATLNPTTNRPDMYVDRLVQATPLWQALSKGPLANNTPFVFPKFVSAADLVDDHVEGVEPDVGSFVATSQTITPAALSGKVEIPREIIDAGGNPQVSNLIWREMQRAYYEALEGKISAHLASLNPTAIALTAGAEDAALVDELEAAYAALQFIPGGFRFDYQADHVTLYKPLAAASDTTGRKLLPRIGATNSNGTSSAKFAALDVAGVTNLPGPTLAGTEADGVRKSYLVASEDVHAWASPPRELRFEYQVAHIDMGIWGYHAEATSRLEGVRVINYNRAGA